MRLETVYDQISQVMDQARSTGPATLRLLRELVNENRAEFLKASPAVLRSMDDPQRLQMYISILASQDLLLPALLDTLTLTDEDAVRYAQVASRIDATLNVKLAKELMEQRDGKSAGDSDLSITRLMEIAANTVDLNSLMPILTQYSRHSSARVRSKATLLIGRVNRNPEWAKQHLADPDPRVRANTVESLWGIDSPAIRLLLREAARDRNNRVAGNAMLGLMRLGDTQAIPLIRDMALNGSETMQLTALWTIGESQDPRFIPLLGKMLRTANTRLRPRIFRALSQVKKRRDEAVAAGRLKVSPLEFSCADDGRRSLVLAVAQEESKQVLDASRLRPSEFIFSENGNWIDEFTAAIASGKDSMGLGVCRPRNPRVSARASDQFEEALKSTLAYKRRADQWAILRQPPVDSRWVFSTEAEAILRGIPGQTGTCRAGDLREMMRAMFTSLRLIKSARNLFLLIDSGEGENPAMYEALIPEALSAIVKVHCVLASGPADPLAEALERLCLATGGRFFAARSHAELQGLVDDLHMSLLPCWKLQWNGPPKPAGEIHLRVQALGELGYGESTWPPHRKESAPDEADLLEIAPDDLAALAEVEADSKSEDIAPHFTLLS